MSGRNRSIAHVSTRKRIVLSMFLIFIYSLAFLPYAFLCRKNKQLAPIHLQSSNRKDFTKIRVRMVAMDGQRWQNGNEFAHRVTNLHKRAIRSSETGANERVKRQHSSDRYGSLPRLVRVTIMIESAGRAEGLVTNIKRDVNSDNSMAITDGFIRVYPPFSTPWTGGLTGISCNCGYGERTGSSRKAGEPARYEPTSGRLRSRVYLIAPIITIYGRDLAAVVFVRSNKRRKR